MSLTFGTCSPGTRLFPVSTIVNAEDRFICGKCHGTFTDLNLFLTHRSTCPIVPSPSLILLNNELEAIIQDVDLSLPSTSNLFYESNPTETASPNDFDLLFTSPVEQIPNSCLASSTLEQDISQMSLLECPVCDEQFDASNVLENHVFEHSTWIDDNDPNSVKTNLAVDESSSSYIDLLDEPPTTPLECKQCTVSFTSNASLNIHKKMSELVFAQFHAILTFFICSSLLESCLSLSQRRLRSTLRETCGLYSSCSHT